jgi:hypothetical protein
MKKIVGLAIAVLMGLIGAPKSAEAAYLPPTDITAFGAICDGTTDTSSFISSMIARYGVAVIPASVNGCAVSAGVGVASASVIGAPGAVIKATNSANPVFTLSGNEPTISNIKFIGSPSVYVQAANGSVNPTISGNWFAGCPTVIDVWYIGPTTGSGITGARSVGNFYDHSANASLSACNPNGSEIVQGVSDFQSTDEYAENPYGFAITVRWSSGTIANWRSHSTTYLQNATATGGQTAFTFNGFVSGLNRFGVQVNGVPLDVSTYSVTPSAGNTNFAVTVPAQSAGTIVTFIGWRSLESININSGSTVTVNGANIDGTGDSGVVIGADYHFNGTNWIFTPGTVLGDFPFLNTIHNVTVTNAYASGIAQTAGCPEMEVDGFNVSKYGLALRDNSNANLFSSGVALSWGLSDSGLCYARLVGGIIDDNPFATYNGNANGAGLYGVMAQPGQVETGGPNKQLSISGVTFRGPFTQQLNFPLNPSLSATAALPSSIDIGDRQGKLFPEQPNWDTAFTTKPTNTNVWTYSAFNSGWGQINSGNLGGTHAMQTIANSYVDQTPLTESTGTGLTFGKLVKVKFWAQSTAPATNVTGSYSCVFATDTQPRGDEVCVTITSTSWQEYTIEVPMMGQLKQGLGPWRIGAPSGGVPANFQWPEISVVDLN